MVVGDCACATPEISAAIAVPMIRRRFMNTPESRMVDKIPGDGQRREKQSFFPLQTTRNSILKQQSVETLFPSES